MKKFTLNSLLIAFVLFAFTSMAQNTRDIVYADDFEAYTVGQGIAQSNPEWWTTWDNAPGTAEDAVISDEQARSGTKSVKFSGNTNDNVVKLGNKTSGIYHLSWYVYIPSGFAGYFNLQHFESPGIEWAVEVYWDNNGTGYIHADGQDAATFNYPQDSWVPVYIIVDLDNDEANLNINNVDIHTWQFSKQAQGQEGAKQLGAINFYAGSTSGMSPTYYIDDLEVFHEYDDVIFEDDFDSYNPGDYVAATIPEFFVTWSNNPGSSEDAKFSNEQSASSPISIKVEGETDLLFKLGNKTSGSYVVEWDMFVPTGMAGYYNLQHFESPGVEWAIEVYWDNDGTGIIHAGGNDAANFNYTMNEWVNVSHLVDVDNDWAELYIDGDLIHEWQFSLQAQGDPGAKQLGAVDFYAGASTGMTPTYFVDNLEYIILIPGSNDPSIEVNSGTIVANIEEGTSTTQNLPITNVGGAPLNVDILPTFDNPGKSSPASAPVVEPPLKGGGEFVVDPNPVKRDPAPTNRNVILHYDNENEGNGVGMTDGAQWVAAVCFPASMVGQYNGMYLSTIHVFINDPADDHKLMVYDMGSINIPGAGELIYEQPFLGLPGWNAIPLVNPIYIDGRDLWVGYWMDQPAGIYPAGCDAGPQVENGAWVKSGPGWRLLTLDYNWNIRAELTGDAAPVWLTATPNEITIDPSETVNVSVGIDANGLEPLNVYKAKLHVRSNDYVHEHIQINVWITVLVGVNEEGEQAFVSMYPNPATTAVTLEANTEIQRVVIVNGIGQIVYDREYNLSNTRIDINDFEAGMYMIRVETANGTAIHKLIKH